MKKLLLLVLPMMLLLFFDSCQKDPCSDVVCYNGGVCVSGSCDCPPGYSGDQCQTADPCYNITCLNGGICVNGLCDCPTGYSGADCSVALTPVSMTITRIDITDYPVIQSSGAGWDVSDGADVYITFNSGTSSNSSFYSSGYYANVTGQDLAYDDNLPITVSNLSSNWVLGVWDYDATSANDFMTGVYFKPSTKSIGFPSSFTLNTPDVSARVYVTWNF